jgi:serine/threonine-protein kinase
VQERGAVIVRRRNAADLPPDQPAGASRGRHRRGYRIRQELERPIDSYNAFDAFTESPGERVVLKLIDKRLGEDERFAARLEDALQRQSAIKHPAMVRVLAGGVAPEGLYVVSAMIRRPTLAAVLAAGLNEVESGGLKPPRAMRMLSRLADVLEVAHRAGLVHGCLQTRSVRVGPDDEIFVDDFALGRLRESKEHYAGPALLYGAPEQFAGEPPTPRSDVYGFAAVAYECLTGAVPYWHGAIAHDGKPPLPIERHSESFLRARRAVRPGAQC